MSNRQRMLTRIAGVILVLCGIPQLVHADAITGTIYFTRYNAHTVNRLTVTYDGVSSLTLSAGVQIAALGGADGVVFNPNNGNLLVGGQGNAVYEVNPTSGSFTTATPGVAAFHMAVDTGGGNAYASGIPGAASRLPLTPTVQNGTVLSIVGNNTSLTSLAFTSNTTGYYTASGASGFGDFGTFTMAGNTITTVRTMTNVPAAHGMVLDPFTGDIMLFGDSHISQIDPSNLSVLLSDRLFSGVNFDQGTVDGTGHAFVADNGGQLLFVDYATTGLIGSLSNFSALRPVFVGTTQVFDLDDVAPLVGPGSNPNPGTVPEPGTIVLLATGLSALGLLRRRNKAS